MISELPFFELLLLTLLPITIGFILFVRIIKIIISFYRKWNSKAERIMMEFGDFMLFLIFFSVIINIVMYIVGNVPDDFSIFDYLILEALPLTWYFILMYGILINLYLFVRSGGQ